MSEKKQKTFKLSFIAKVSSNKRVCIPTRIHDVKDGDTVLVTIESVGEETINQ